MHVLHDAGEVVHLDVVIPSVISDHGVVRAGAQVGRQLGGEGDGVVLEAVEVDDAERGVGQGVVSPEGRPAHRAHRGQAPRQSLHRPGPNEHPAIGGPGHVDPVRVDTPAVQDVVEDGLSEDHVIITGGKSAGVLIVAAVSADVTRGVAGVVKVQAWVTR